MTRNYRWFLELMFLLLMFVPDYAVSQSKVNVVTGYSYRRYTFQDGLPDMKVRTLRQDGSGFIWIGMLDGFAYFDGIRFVPYTPDIQSTALGIKINTDGSPIIKSARYNHTVDRVSQKIYSVKISDTLYYDSPNSRNLPFPYSIYENLQGDKKYLVKEQDQKLNKIDMPEFFNNIGEGKVFFEPEKGIMLLPGRQVFIYNINNEEVREIKSLSAESFLKLKNGDILALGQDGIYKIDIDHAVASPLLSYHFDYNLIALESNNGIIISDFNCIYRFFDNHIEIIASLSMVRDILLDVENNLWVATYSGLYNFFNLNFKTYQLPDNDVVMSMTEDDDGEFVWATLNGQLIKDENNTFKTVSFSHFGYPIFSFSAGAASYKRKMYFPLPVGLMIKDKGSCKLADLPVGNVKRVHINKDGNLLFSIINQGVYECNENGEIVHYYGTQQFGQNLTDAVYDNDGRKILLGVQNLFIIENEQIKSLPTLQKSTPNVLCCDHDNGIWIGQESYLNIFFNNKIEQIYQFRNNTIKDIIVADNGWLVIATKMGIAMLNTKEFYANHNVSILWFDHQNGATLLNPNLFGLYKQKDGTIRMLCAEGVLSFSPEKLIDKISPPTMRLLTVSFSQDNVHWTLQKAYKKIVLDYKTNNINFSFIGLKYSAAQNIRYYARLKGMQDEWVTYNSTREISYNNLPPGKYVFEIYADAGTSDSKSAIQSVEIIIRPAFWQTWQFLLFVIIASVALIFLVIYIIIKKRYEKKTKALKLEAQLNDLKIKSIRLKAIPHFNSNVLAAVEYYVMNMPKEEVNRVISIYSNYTNRMLRDVELAARSLSDEIEFVTLYLQLEQLRFQDKFDYQIKVDPLCDLNALIPNMVLHTYCENAIKHGFAGNRKDFMLLIEVKQQEEYLMVCVEDNGIGRKAAAERKPQSTKQGLTILSRQIEIYNTLNKNKILQIINDLHDENGAAAGTRFELIVPVQYEYQFKTSK